MLIRGARQVGKSSAVRQLGKEFKYFVEINLESQPSIRGLFPKDIDVHRTCEGISATTGIPIIPGETLLFIDEIQVSQEAIMSLRYFKEDYPKATSSAPIFTMTFWTPTKMTLPSISRACLRLC